ncbi:hypothetical protein [Escherichia coli]|uniref:hypothetical protein n=1 Tax=Escherichia coli TaxID=562 RepID=UPI0037DDA9E0
MATLGLIVYEPAFTFDVVIWIRDASGPLVFTLNRATEGDKLHVGIASKHYTQLVTLVVRDGAGRCRT